MKTISLWFLLLFFAQVIHAKCPNFEEHLLWVPKDKIEAKPDLLKKAKSLNNSGQCVVEGGFGRQAGKFYITVSPTGEVEGAKILKFTREEL